MGRDIALEGLLGRRYFVAGNRVGVVTVVRKGVRARARLGANVVVPRQSIRPASVMDGSRHDDGRGGACASHYVTGKRHVLTGPLPWNGKDGAS